MAVMKTHISWADSTWNPTVGCSKVSAGCDNCYAEAMVRRLMDHDFGDIQIYPKRLMQADGFQPIEEQGRLRPRKVFVNSMSDLFHEDIPDSFRDQVFDKMEATPKTVYIILTKRPIRMRRYVVARYKPDARHVPWHIWLGVSVEDATVGGRLNILRKMKERVGDFTAVVSIEPLIGALTGVDFEGIDWGLIGGESRQMGQLRVMVLDHARQARDMLLNREIAVHFKQFGDWKANPLYGGPGKHIDKVLRAIGRGEELAFVEPDEKRPGRMKILGEKGGATLDGNIWRQDPIVYKILTDRLNETKLL